MATITLENSTAPSTPASNQVVVYADSADSDLLKVKDDAGVVHYASAEWGNVPTTVLPTSDNGLDLGSSSKAWRTIYIDTSIILGAAASKIVPGATSFAIRNNADSADNLIITNAGAATVRTSLAVTTSASVGTSLTTGTTLTVGTSLAVSGKQIDMGDVVTLQQNGSGTAGVTYLFRNGAFDGANFVRSVADNDVSAIQFGATGDIIIMGNTDANTTAGSTVTLADNVIFKKNGRMGVGTVSPQSKFHVYDTDGGVLFWRGVSINTTPQTILTGLADLGNVTVAAVASNGTIDVNSLTLIPSGFQTLFGGELRVDTSADGTVTIYRASGAKTFDVALWIVYR